MVSFKAHVEISFQSTAKRLSYKTHVKVAFQSTAKTHSYIAQVRNKCKKRIPSTAKAHL